MPARVEIRGTEEFRRTAAKLKAAGGGKVVREMAKKMKTAARPAVEDARRSVKATSARASRGGGGQARRAHTQSSSRRRKVTERAKQKAFEGRGLRATIARILTTIVRTTGSSAGVQIRTRAAMLPQDQRRLPMHMNTGTWKHPVFGNPTRWVTQTVSPPEWFDRPMRAHGPKVRDKAIEVIDEINRDIAN